MRSKLGRGSLMRPTGDDSEGSSWLIHERKQLPGPSRNPITIADSMVLVVGVAVALSLRWFSGWVQTPQP